MIGTIPEKILRTEMHRRMMEAGVALERYRRARGEFPVGLEQLGPDYLGGVPEDLGAPEPGTPSTKPAKATATGSRRIRS